MRGRLRFLWNKLTREFGFLPLCLVVTVVGGIVIGFGAPQAAHARVDREDQKDYQAAQANAQIDQKKAEAVREACSVLENHPNFKDAQEQCVTDTFKSCSSKSDQDFTMCVQEHVASVQKILTITPKSDETCANASFLSGMNFKCMILDTIQYILGKIVWGLGKILTFLIEIFLGFAQYNGFSNAPPVLLGWKLIRDLVNMFFIVILLVSAFATIIGYGGEDFHATRVLPKLLLMAVLINFSKTLIQLLIDFSQVVMLTFVNAFQTTASAQLVDAFGLTIITQESKAGGMADFMNFIISYLLGIVVLIIAIGVMVILIGFIIGRIVGLWMALIFSPLALFATAIPSKLQKGMGSLTTEYWGNLTGMLVGGPIIAFYLWLTMAILQGASAGGEQLSESLKLYNPTGAVDQNGFFTQLGQSVSIAKFIIAITLLMMA
ncbi:MAG: hypothetical protein Q8R07_00970, partial [Candidatus Uhrbacteria bacterium]|nr:hypothetical protein [Candidatus Uhrbacteria bacterium]